MNVIWKILTKLRTLIKMLGATALVVMTFLTCADVVGRYIGMPIFGTVEIVGYLAVLTVIMGLAYTHEVNGHVGVELIFRHFSKKTQDLLELVTTVVSLILFGIITWRMFLYAGNIKTSGEVSMNLAFPEHIIIYITALCFLVLVFTMVEEIIKTLLRIAGRK